MKSTNRIVNNTAPARESPNAGSECRHYLGLWHLNISDSSDVLGCAWRDHGQWYVRFRFRHDLDFPLCYETRYERCGGLEGEADARAFMDQAFRAANVLGRPITFECIEGGADQAIKLVFGKPGLLGWAMDEQTYPVVPEAAANLLNTIFIRNYQAGCLRHWEHRAPKEFEQVLAASGELPTWQPNQLGLWVLDIIAVAPGDPQWDAIAQAKIKERREQWTTWAQSLRLHGV